MYQKLSDLSDTFILLETTKGDSMNELALENITKTKCLECGDSLTSWETSGYCIICEPDEYDIYKLSDPSAKMKLLNKEP